MSPKGLILDGIASSNAWDSSAERLDVEGCSIDTLAESGTLNYEHLSAQDAQKEKVLGQEKVGTILYARKLLKESDCETDRQREWFKKLDGLKAIYVIGRLADGAGHTAAQALAAMMRDHHAHGEKLLVRMSVEGGTLQRQGQELKQTYARDLALTYKPCNRTCDVGILYDPCAPEGFEKEIVPRDQWEHLLKTEPLPQDVAPLAKDDPRLPRWLALQALKKVLSAGSTSAAPGQLTGGAALSREDPKLGWRVKAEQLRRDYGEPYDADEFKRILRQHLPEASEEFLSHFEDVSDDVKVPAKVLGKSELSKAAMDPAQYTLSHELRPEREVHPSEGFYDGCVRRGRRLYEQTFTVNAHTSDGERVGQADFFIRDKDLYPGNVEVDEAHRRRGIASAMYAHAEKIVGKKVVPSDDQTEDAEALWAANKRKPQFGKRRVAKAEQPTPMVSPVPTQLTLAGQPLRPNPHVPRPFVDLAAGAIHTPRGTFSLRQHSDQEVAQLRERWTSPEVAAMFDGAMESWARLNAALRAGQPPEAVLRLAVLYLGLPAEEPRRAELADICARHRADGQGAAEELLGTMTTPPAARAAMSLLGASGMIPVDPPLLADLFGVQQGERAALDYLSQLLDDPKAANLRSGLDQLYQRHPAVQYLRNHSRWAGLFPDEMAAVTPAAWLHWLAVAPTSPWAQRNSGALWRTADPFAKAEVDHLWTLPRRCAQQLALWQHQYGQVPAILLALRYLVPHLLESRPYAGQVQAA